MQNLTARLNAYSTAAPEERARLWEDMFPTLKRLARNRISAVGLQGRQGPTELVVAQYEGLDKALGRADASWENRARFFSYGGGSPFASEERDSHEEQRIFRRGGAGRQAWRLNCRVALREISRDFR